jgi:hypothetical protein
MTIEFELDGGLSPRARRRQVDIRAQGTCFDRAFSGEVMAVSVAPRRRPCVCLPRSSSAVANCASRVDVGETCRSCAAAAVPCV